jgi:hypothetical protein
MFCLGVPRSRVLPTLALILAASGCAVLPPSDNAKSGELRAARQAMSSAKERIYENLAAANGDQAIVVYSGDELDVLVMRGGQVVAGTDVQKLRDAGSVCAYYYPLSTPIPASWVECGTAQREVSTRLEIEQLQAQVRSLQSQLEAVRASLNDQDLELTEKYGELEIIVKEIEDKIAMGTVLTSDVVKVLVQKIEELKVRVDAGIPNYSN